MEEDATVSFGKYKGRPLSHLVADRSYCEWLRSQEWMKKKEGTAIYNVLYNVHTTSGNEDQPTPEHNAMQNRFLDQDFRDAFLDALAPGRRAAVAEAADTLSGQADAAIDRFRCDHVDVLTGVETKVVTGACITELVCFEPECGGDVLLRTNNSWVAWIDVTRLETDLHARALYENEDAIGHVWVPLYNPSEDEHSHIHPECDGTGYYCWHYKCAIKKGEKEREDAWHRARAKLQGIQENLRRELKLQHWAPVPYEVLIECKPSMGDDYPCVLRKMSKLRHSKRVLLVGEFTSAVTTWEQLVKIFALSGIHVMLLCDVSRARSAKRPRTLCSG